MVPFHLLQVLGCSVRVARRREPSKCHLPKLRRMGYNEDGSPPVVPEAKMLYARAILLIGNASVRVYAGRLTCR